LSLAGLELDDDEIDLSEMTADEIAVWLDDETQP
jgi:hypothetical protein